MWGGRQGASEGEGAYIALFFFITSSPPQKTRACKTVGKKTKKHERKKRACKSVGESKKQLELKWLTTPSSVRLPRLS